MIKMKPESVAKLAEARAALAEIGLTENAFIGLRRAEMCEEWSEIAESDGEDSSYEHMARCNAGDSWNYVMDEFRDAREHLDGIED